MLANEVHEAKPRVDSAVLLNTSELISVEESVFRGVML